MCLSEAESSRPSLDESRSGTDLTQNVILHSLLFHHPSLYFIPHTIISNFEHCQRYQESRAHANATPNTHRRCTDDQRMLALMAATRQHHRHADAVAKQKGVDNEELCYASTMPDPLLIGRASYLFEYISRFLPRLRELKWDAVKTDTSAGYGGLLVACLVVGGGEFVGCWLVCCG